MQRRHLAGLLATVLATSVAGAACAPVGSGSAGQDRAGDARGPLVPPPADAWQGVVTHISDGDTLWVEVTGGDAPARRGTEVKLRLLRIDTPELARGGGEAECFAPQAHRHLSQLVPEGSTVGAAPDVELRDQYGRALVHLWTDDGDWVNGRMLADGYATVVTFPPNVAWSDQVLRLEARARDAGAGLWSACR